MMIDAATRSSDLRDTLNQRRLEMLDDVQIRKHVARGRRPNEGDDLERSEAGIQGGIDAALLQMRAETLSRIDEALLRLDTGQYGTCFECDAEISQSRLRALPFAVRCQACEERREHERVRARRLAGHHRDFPLFQDALNS
jgi:DnaK suppressor protein